MQRDPISRLEQELTVTVRRLDMNYRRRGHPMERAHYLLLTQLEDGAKSTGEIATRLGLDHSTVVRQVAAVEQRGFAERIPNPKDRRSVLVQATPRGAAAVIDMRHQRRVRLDGILADWPEAERAQFADILARFNAAVMLDDDRPAHAHGREP
jgi:DNA-binding MarR family transcriptional regulator